MKIIYLSIVSSLIIAACATQPSKNVTKEDVKIEETPKVVGNDADEHGCKPSTGYQWSVLKNECIRIFEAGIRLNPKAANLDQTTSTFIIFKSENEISQVEVFMPTKNSFILSLNEDNSKQTKWVDKEFSLITDHQQYRLYDANNKLLYESEITK